MAWIILYANEDELRRMPLERAVTIGRSPECEIAVRDILLSRQHSRIEPVGANGAWRVIDMGSKNGTRVGWQKVQSHVLREGDWLRMGRTRVRFFLSEFQPAAEDRPRGDRLVRPADPHEALSGTVTDFVLDDEEPTRNDEDGIGWDGPRGRTPSPQPRPSEPAGGFEPSPDNLLEELAVAISDAESSREGRAPQGVEGLEFFPAPGGNSSDAATAVAQPAAQRAVKSRKLPNVKPVFREVAAPYAREASLSLQVAALDLPDVAAAHVIRRPRSRQRQALIVVGWALAAATSTALMGISAWVLAMSR